MLHTLRHAMPDYSWLRYYAAITPLIFFIFAQRPPRDFAVYCIAAFSRYFACFTPAGYAFAIFMPTLLALQPFDADDAYADAAIDAIHTIRLLYAAIALI